MKRFFKFHPVIIISVVALTFLCGCSSDGKDTLYSRSALYFDTAVSVDIYASSPEEAEQVLGECMNICSHYTDLFDSKIITSDIAKINNSAGKPVTVDPDTVMLISKALNYCSISDGGFDITIEPVSDLWDFHEGSERVPSDAGIKEALSSVNWKNLSVDPENNTITLNKPCVSIDVGGVAKGFVADKITEYLMSQHITGAIINMGGDMRILGSKPDGSLFNIGITDPFSKGSVSTALYLSDTSVATSGTYERCFEKNGVLYHHILDTQTGYPCQTDIKSVTVITPYATDSDCLCTVCIIKGSTEALRLIENIPDTEAILILEDGSILMTSGASNLIRQ